jgi:hypothetical protein
MGPHETAGKGSADFPSGSPSESPIRKSRRVRGPQYGVNRQASAEHARKSLACRLMATSSPSGKLGWGWMRVPAWSPPPSCPVFCANRFDALPDSVRSPTRMAERLAPAPISRVRNRVIGRTESAARLAPARVAEVSMDSSRHPPVGVGSYWMHPVPSRRKDKARGPRSERRVPQAAERPHSRDPNRCAQGRRGEGAQGRGRPTVLRSSGTSRHPQTKGGQGPMFDRPCPPNSSAVRQGYSLAH